MKFRLFVAALAVALIGPKMAAAQGVSPNPFNLEPYVGSFVDTDPANAGGNIPGVLLGLRLGYELSDRARLTGNVGYSEVSDVGTPNRSTDYFVYNKDYLLTTAGAEYDVIPGRTSASLGLQLGIAWDKIETAGRVGDPPLNSEFMDDGYSPDFTVVPGVTVRHQLMRRAALTLGLQDYMLFVGPVLHSPALTLGVSFR